MSSRLLDATSASDDPCIMVQSAARQHIPVQGVKSDQGTSDSYKTVPEAGDRPAVADIITEIENADWYRDQISQHKILTAKDARYGTFDPPLSQSISQALHDARSIDRFYIHQVEAIKSIAAGKNVMLSTPTASGKSAIYQVPFLQLLEDNPTAKAIFVYPTKALAQDQKAAMEQLLYSCTGLEHIRVSTYDGDTPNELRRGKELSNLWLFLDLTATVQIFVKTPA